MAHVRVGQLRDVVLAFGCSRSGAEVLRILERDSLQTGDETKMGGCASANSRGAVERTELESILRRIDSQLDMSVRAFLQKEESRQGSTGATRVAPGS